MKAFTLAFYALLPIVYSHSVITSVNGANGIDSDGFGVDPTTPRDGSANKPFQQDTSIIRDREIASGRAGPCGRTQQAGNVDVQAEMTAAVANGLATAASDGSVTMTVHQVNQDGAGPFTCDVDATGTGQSFQAMQVTQDVPGDVPFVGSLSRAKATDFQLVAKMPAGMTCSGPGGACLVRCRNNAIAGPFGSCVAGAYTIYQG
ncbi:hypothetical protein BT69DRAFT_1219522 [Atractiella rhizophila]|nr:hypothetical protein BT69DRAFT_1219522 [Atractiella rhizophila]